MEYFVGFIEYLRVYTSTRSQTEQGFMLGQNWTMLDSNGIALGLFRISFQFILAK